LVYDVAIAGAGPVGLFLACELSLANVSVLVLETAENPRSPLKEMPLGMRGLTIPTAEAFYRRGMLEDVVPSLRIGSNTDEKSSAQLVDREQQPRRQAGHFAGIGLDAGKIDSSRWKYLLPNPASTNQAAEMECIETVLTFRAQSLGVEIRRGLGVTGFEQTDEVVSVQAGDQIFHAKWLVGCDGGRSIVRKAGGFEFVGTDPKFTGYSALVDIADPESLRAGRNLTPTGMYHQPKPGQLAMLDFDGGAFHRTETITLDHLQAVLRRVSGTDVTIATVHLATSWTDRAQQATTYRLGRVMLAGDAAHIHSPLGGQGLNLGLGDAMNLGWKLAATIHGKAPDGLLDTYTTERHPIGAAVLDWSRAQVAIMSPGPDGSAVEKIIRDLMDTRDGTTYFAERLWNVSLRYDLGGDHPLVGRSVPDFEFENGSRVAALLKDGTGLLVDFDSNRSLQALASGWSNQITYFQGNPKERLGLSAVLVRPDGYVAWASETNGEFSGADVAASRWFGDPDLIAPDCAQMQRK
jgi:2-polyprenyl-6-methoxyphenol hydroxylase-like FAD-dependent oxidoreductase